MSESLKYKSSGVFTSVGESGGRSGVSGVEVSGVLLEFSVGVVIVVLLLLVVFVVVVVEVVGIVGDVELGGVVGVVDGVGLGGVVGVVVDVTVAVGVVEVVGFVGFVEGFVVEFDGVVGFVRFEGEFVGDFGSVGFVEDAEIVAFVGFTVSVRIVGIVAFFGFTVFVGIAEIVGAVAGSVLEFGSGVVEFEFTIAEFVGVLEFVAVVGTTFSTFSGFILLNLATKNPSVSSSPCCARKSFSDPFMTRNPLRGHSGTAFESFQKAPFSFRAFCTTSSFSSWLIEQVEYTTI